MLEIPIKSLRDVQDFIVLYFLATLHLSQNQKSMKFPDSETFRNFLRFFGEMERPVWKIYWFFKWIPMHFKFSWNPFLMAGFFAWQTRFAQGSKCHKKSIKFRDFPENSGFSTKKSFFSRRNKIKSSFNVPVQWAKVHLQWSESRRFFGLKLEQ